MTTHIGYPEEILNNTLLDQHYEGLNLREDNIIKNG